MRCRNHRVVKIEVGSSLDTFNITCFCGKFECCGTWWTTAPKGWAKRPWPKVVQSAELLLQSFGRSSTVA